MWEYLNLCDEEGRRSKCNVGFAITKAKYESLDAVFKYGDIEIKKQTQFPSTKFKIRESLGAVNWVNGFNRLRLDHDRIVHQGVQTIAAIQFNAFVNHRERFLCLMRNTTKAKLATQRRFIGSFDLSGTKFAVDFDRGTDDEVCKFVRFHATEIRFCKRASK